MVLVGGDGADHLRLEKEFICAVMCSQPSKRGAVIHSRETVPYHD